MESIFRLFLTLVILAGLTHGGTCEKDHFECSIAKFGKLMMFSGELGNVELPCKYILTEMTCGDWKVKVTGGSISDPTKINRYSPHTIWLKVEQVSKPNKIFLARTDVDNIEDKKFVFNIKEEESNFKPSKLEYDESRKGAVMSEPGAYEVFFGVDRTLRIKCQADKFENTAYPQSLCGNGAKNPKNVQGLLRKELFGNMPHTIERSYVLTYHILDNARVTQSTQCEGISRKFQRCKKDKLQAEAIARCARVFSDRSLSKCLNTKPNKVNAFRLCIKLTGCNRDEAVKTGPKQVCQFLKDQVKDRGCPDEWNEIAKEIDEC